MPRSRTTKSKATTKKTTRSARPKAATRTLTPPVQSVFIQLTRLDGQKFDMGVFFDAAGQEPMTNDRPLELLGNGKGKLQFNFIPSAAGGAAVTADLVIIAQTVRDGTALRGQRRDTPFRHPFRIPAGKFYPTYYLPSPAGDKDPTNLQCKLTCGAPGYVPGKTTLDVKKAPSRRRTGPYKYTIMALCDGATCVTGIDPTGIINPH